MGRKKPWLPVDSAVMATLLSGAVACTAVPKRPPCGPKAFATASGHCVPDAWFCSPALYNAGPQDGCDCNCGAKDPDCARKGRALWCYGLGMARRVDSCALCDAAPGERLLQELYSEP